MSALASIRRIAILCGELGPDELRVVERVAERMCMGRRQYGELCIRSDTRNWRKQTHEELLDAVAYLAIETLEDEEQ